MKKTPLLILFIIMVNSNLTAQNDVVSAFLLKWENSKNYLLEIEKQCLKPITILHLQKDK